MRAAIRGRALLLAGVGAVAVFGVAGCAEDEVSAPDRATESLIDNPIDPLSLDTVLDGVDAQDLPVTARHDVTDEVCPTAGCASAMAADELTVLHFPTTGRAEIYLGKHPDSFQVLDIVVTFPDSISPQQREEYSQAVKVAVR
ncbi:hypothetical protein VX037_00035 [Gordonia sp. Z-3]|uniref:DUF3558 domain-containing protein n=1 Tax=Gordonia aquimaris TaxID=2984863 RepID=A0A9X3I511_9ACTN|nr:MULTISPECIES: hypothetical protein [Gordonia]MAU82223.1 hypothetical protein [Gordonia sp. (in: high G+C Gram-positive bacteria)]MCX2964560.1 hypothetical protein [Gordonia aquimaris]MED5799418.1 hypothetical protein [Gordonia sp. Z-3]